MWGERQPFRRRRPKGHRFGHGGRPRRGPPPRPRLSLSRGRARVATVLDAVVEIATAVRACLDRLGQRLNNGERVVELIAIHPGYPIVDQDRRRRRDCVRLW